MSQEPPAAVVLEESCSSVINDVIAEFKTDFDIEVVSETKGSTDEPQVSCLISKPFFGVSEAPNAAFEIQIHFEYVDEPVEPVDGEPYCEAIMAADPKVRFMDSDTADRNADGQRYCWNQTTSSFNLRFSQAVLYDRHMKVQVLWIGDVPLLSDGETPFLGSVLDRTEKALSDIHEAFTEAA